MKKLYMQPCVEATQLQLSTMVLAGSPDGGANISAGTGGTEDIGGSPIGD